MPGDRDDEVNFKNFAKALAITSGASVSAELGRGCFDGFDTFAAA